MLFPRATAYGIVEGRITARLQASRPKAKIGNDYAVQVKPRQGQIPGPAIGDIRVTSVTLIKRGEVTDGLARAAGFQGLAALRARWTDRYGAWDEDAWIWVVRFEKLRSRSDADDNWRVA